MTAVGMDEKAMFERLRENRPSDAAVVQMLPRAVKNSASRQIACRCYPAAREMERISEAGHRRRAAHVGGVGKMSKKIGRITMLAVALWFLSGASVWSLPEPMLLTEKEMAEVVGRHLPAAPKSGEWCTEYDGCELIGNTYWFVDGRARHCYCDTTGSTFDHCVEFQWPCCRKRNCTTYSDCSVCNPRWQPCTTTVTVILLWNDPEPEPPQVCSF